MTLYTIVNMKYIIIDHIKDSSDQLCNTIITKTIKQLWPHNQNVNVTFCVFYLLSGYSSKTFRSSEMSHFRLYQIHISLFILIAACITFMSSFLLICWRFFLMFGVWLSVPRLFIVFSSVSTLKCTSWHLLWVSNILWIAANLTPLYPCLFYFPCY